MKFLVDEDVSVKLIKALKSLNHDAVRVEPSSSDRDLGKFSLTKILNDSIMSSLPQFPFPLI